MRGGAIPLLCWATLLLALFAGNWAWDGQAINAAEAGFAALVIYAWALALWLASRESVRRGPPPRDARPQALPDASLAAVLAGLSVACIMFGTAWSGFLVDFGVATLVLSLGRLALERRAQRAAQRRGIDRRQSR